MLQAEFAEKIKTQIPLRMGNVRGRSCRENQDTNSSENGKCYRQKLQRKSRHKFFLEWEMLQAEVAEKMKTQILLRMGNVTGRICSENQNTNYSYNGKCYRQKLQRISRHKFFIELEMLQAEVAEKIKTQILLRMGNFTGRICSENQNTNYSYNGKCYRQNLQ